MQFRSVLSLFFLAFLMLVASSTLAEDGSSEDVCEGSTGGIDHLLYDENGELIFFASAVLEETEDWVRYPCKPEATAIGDKFEVAREAYPWYKQLPNHRKKCVYTNFRPLHDSVDVRFLAAGLNRRVYPNLFAVKVNTVVGAFRFFKETGELFPGFLLSIEPTEVIDGKAPPSTVFVPFKGRQNIHGVNFCNGSRLGWRVNTVPEKGDQMFVLFHDFADEVIPILDTPTLILRDEELMSPLAISLDSNYEEELPTLTTVENVLSYLRRYR